jgi:SAM-dependent methyltransferase
MTDGSRYVHGTDPDEQRRLSAMNALINPPLLRELGLRGGEAILDVGAGLGQFTRAMARAAGPGSRVVGIERDPRQLERARGLADEAGEADLVELRPGDALDLPLDPSEWGTFDVAHTRFLLEHVPRPGAVVEAMVRAVRRGGRVVLADDDHPVLRAWPEPEGFGALWSAYMLAFEGLGNDPQVGRRLVQLLHQAGAAPRRNTWVFFGSCAGSRSWDTISTNLVEVIRGARETLLSRGLLAAAPFDRAIDGLRAWSARPDAALWYGIAWAEGVREV